MLFITNDPECTPSGSPTRAYLKVKDLNTGLYMTIYEFSDLYGWISVPNGTEKSLTPEEYSKLKLYFQEDHEYEVSLRVIRPCISAAMTLHYYGGELTYNDQNVETGGSRIKRIIAEDPIANNIGTTTYYYNEYANLNESSGEVGAKGYYISTRTERIPGSLPCSFEDCERYVLGSNSFIPLFNTGKQYLL